MTYWRLSCRESTALCSREWAKIATKPQNGLLWLWFWVSSQLLLYWILCCNQYEFLQAERKNHTLVSEPWEAHRPMSWLVRCGTCLAHCIGWFHPHFSPHLPSPSFLSPLSSFLPSLLWPPHISFVSCFFLPSSPPFPYSLLNKENDMGWPRLRKHSSENESSWCILGCLLSAFCFGVWRRIEV